MKYRWVLLLILLLLPLGVQAQQNTPPPGTETERAQQMLTEIAHVSNIGLVYAQFSDQLKVTITQAQLGGLWIHSVGQYGAFNRVFDVQADAANHIVTETLLFAKGPVDAVITFDATTELVTGIQFVPSTNPAAMPVPTPGYDQSTFTETRVHVGKYNLPGELTMPNGSGPFPAVVLISGAGPNDMDATIGRNKPFRDLAWGLAAQGIASVRFDKSTHIPVGAFDLTHLTVQAEYVDDGVAAIDLLRQTDGIDPARVFILGHGQGSYLLPRIAEADPNAAGLILAAGEALPIPQETLRRLRYVASLAPAGATEDPTIAEMEAEANKIDTLTADSPADQPVFNEPPSYWLDLQGYDPVALAATLPQPILVLQGGRDYQATLADDYPVWQKGLVDHPDTTFKTYTDLNHIFVTGAGMSTPSEYNQPGNVAQTVIDDIAAWVKAH